MRLSISLILIFCAYCVLLIPSFAESILVEGTEEIIPLLTYTKYFEEPPVLFFSRQAENRDVNWVNKIDSIVLKDGTKYDLAIELSSIRLIDSGSFLRFDLEKGGVYEIWLVNTKDKNRTGLEKIEISINGKKEIKVFKYIGKYTKAAEMKLEADKHNIEINDRKKERIDFILSDKYIRQKVFKKIERKGSKLSYILQGNNNRFYVPHNSIYSIKAKLEVPIVEEKKKSKIIYYNFDRYEEIRNWSFFEEECDFSVDKSSKFIMSVFFDGSKDEDEYIRMERIDNINIDLKRYPILELGYRIEDPSVQTIQIVAGIDFNNDNKVDRFIEDMWPRPASVEWSSYAYGLYSKVIGSFPSEQYYRLIYLEVYPHKIWGVDCSGAKKGRYRFWIGYVQFYEQTITGEFYKDSADAIDIKMYLKEDRDKWRLQYKSDNYDLKDGFYLYPSQYIERKMILEPIDLSKFQMLEYEYEVKDSYFQKAKLILDIDTSNDNSIDENISLELIDGRSPHLINIFKLLEDLKLKRKGYKLMQIRLGLKDCGLGSIKKLRIFSESLIPIDEYIPPEPRFKLDGKEVALRDIFINNVRDLWFKGEVYLTKGEHNLIKIKDNILETGPIIIEPITSHIKNNNPKIIFRKINPAKYQVEVKYANEPFWLVFSESYHEKWKIYLDEDEIVNNGEKDKGSFVSYPQLGIKESRHSVRFVPGDISYLLKEQLGVEHYMVNGYANGWYIDPARLNLEENFSLILFFWPQAIFYLGLGITCVIFILCLIYYFYQLLNKRSNK